MTEVSLYLGLLFLGVGEGREDTSVALAVVYKYDPQIKKYRNKGLNTVVFLFSFVDIASGA